jgi:probable phosphoglycerate mutase
LLALRLPGFDFARISASREPKARQTAMLVASVLDVPVAVRAGLHEHDRDGLFVDDRLEFERLVRAVFERPGEPVFGNETGSQALTRFEAAVDAVLSEAPGRDSCIVAHGTVISLYVAAKCGVDGFALWQKLGLPSYVVLETPSMKLLDVVAELGHM